MSDHRVEVTPSDADERALERLIRAVLSRSSAPAERPRENSVVAYLDGSATPQQLNKVQKALLQSAGFRQELLALAEDVQQLEQPASQARFDAAAVGTIQDAPGFMQRVEERHRREGRQRVSAERPSSSDRLRIWLASLFGISQDQGEASVSGRRRVGSPWGPLGWRLTGVAVVAGVVAVIVFGTGVLMSPGGPHLVKLQAFEPLQRIVFEPLRSGSSPEIVIPESTARAAAARSFMRRIEMTAGEFRLVSQDQQRPSSSSDHTMRLEVSVSGEDAPHVVSLRLPKDAADVQVWLLDVPSLWLHGGNMKGETARISHPKGKDDRWCATATYSVDGGYAATEAVAVVGW